MDDRIEGGIESLVLREQIADRLAQFDDAVLTNDRDAFLALWTTDGVWEIGAYNPHGSREISPLRAHGHDELTKALAAFADMNAFFFRGTFRPVVRLAGETATVRVPTVEYARRKDGSGYANVALYSDELVRADGVWRFRLRRYDYIWVDSHTPIRGGDAIPLSPAATRPLQ